MRLSRRDLYAALGTGYRDTLLTYRGTHPSGCYGVAIAHKPSPSQHYLVIHQSFN